MHQAERRVSASRCTCIVDPFLASAAERHRAPAQAEKFQFGLAFRFYAKLHSKRLMHALIIEDEWLTAQLIEDCLRELGYDSFGSAMSEDEAVIEAAQHSPDIITSDVQLSIGCGIDAVERICAEKPVPIFYITSNVAMVLERCPRALIVRKPFGMADFISAERNARTACHPRSSPWRAS